MERDREKTVMLVDDEQSVLVCISALLRSFGISVHPFATPEAALEAYPSLAPDLVLTDLKMPGMNGLELLREIRTIDDDAPVIIITGYANLDMTDEASRMKACKVLIKPCEPETLINAVVMGIEAARSARRKDRNDA